MADRATADSTKARDALQSDGAYMYPMMPRCDARLLHATPRRRVPTAVVLVALLQCAHRSVRADDDLAITLMTRDGVAEQMDTYTYTFAAMPAGDHFIKWFEPKADMSVVHHMLLFGCEENVSPTLHTRSGGMFSAGGGEPRGAVCETHDEPFIFGWGKNAPPLHLPEHTGFRVGNGGFRHLVLEVHYLEAQDKDAITQSGLVVHLEPGIPRRPMSVIAFATGREAAPNQNTLVENRFHKSGAVYVFDASNDDYFVESTCYTTTRPVYFQMCESRVFAFRFHEPRFEHVSSSN